MDLFLELVSCEWYGINIPQLVRAVLFTDRHHVAVRTISYLIVFSHQCAGLVQPVS